VHDAEHQTLVPSSEIERRIASLQDALRNAGLGGALVVEAADLYYLAGTVQDAHLRVPAAGPAALYVRRSLERAQAESPLDHVEPLRSLRDLPRALAALGCAGRIGLELDILPAARFLAYQDLLPRAVLP
jgi:Xaa-Pro dipeptidase